MPEMASLQQLLGFSVSPLELMLRGSAVYWGLFLLFRFALRRDAGALGIADILLLVLIADASQNAMSGSYQSISEGAVLVLTIVGWNMLMDWAAFRFNVVRRFAEPDPLVLIRRGHMLFSNMRREYISTPELMAHLREQGIDKLADVKLARMEPDGRISVIRYASAPDAEPAPPHEAQTGG